MMPDYRLFKLSRTKKARVISNCADVEQELVLFWRGDVEAGIINRDGFRATASILADAEEKRHLDNPLFR